MQSGAHENACKEFYEHNINAFGPSNSVYKTIILDQNRRG